MKDDARVLAMRRIDKQPRQQELTPNQRFYRIHQAMKTELPKAMREFEKAMHERRDMPWFRGGKL